MSVQTEAERQYDAERVRSAVIRLRTALRAADRNLKNALDGGLTADDAHALMALALRAERDASNAADSLRHIHAREAGRRAREAAE